MVRSEFTHRTDRPSTRDGKESVRLIGAEQNCKCRAIKSLPIVVPAAGQVDIEVDVKLGSKSSFALLTTSQQQARLVCRWRESE